MKTGGELKKCASKEKREEERNLTHLTFSHLVDAHRMKDTPEELSKRTGQGEGK